MFIVCYQNQLYKKILSRVNHQHYYMTVNVHCSWRKEYRGNPRSCELFLSSENKALKKKFISQLACWLSWQSATPTSQRSWIQIPYITVPRGSRIPSIFLSALLLLSVDILSFIYLFICFSQSAKQPVSTTPLTSFRKVEEFGLTTGISAPVREVTQSPSKLKGNGSLSTVR